MIEEYDFRLKGVIVTEDTECPMKRHTSSDDQEIKKKKMEQIDVSVK